MSQAEAAWRSGLGPPAPHLHVGRAAGRPAVAAAEAALRALLPQVALLLAQADQAFTRRALGQHERAVSFVAALATQGAKRVTLGWASGCRGRLRSTGPATQAEAPVGNKPGQAGAPPGPSGMGSRSVQRGRACPRERLQREEGGHGCLLRATTMVPRSDPAATCPAAATSLRRATRTVSVTGPETEGGGGTRQPKRGDLGGRAPSRSRGGGLTQRREQRAQQEPEKRRGRFVRRVFFKCGHTRELDRF